MMGRSNTASCTCLMYCFAFLLNYEIMMRHNEQNFAKKIQNKQPLM